MSLEDPCVLTRAVSGAVANRQHVSAGDQLDILESMKMEIPVASPVSGTVREIFVPEGGVLREGDLIAVVA